VIFPYFLLIFEKRTPLPPGSEFLHPPEYILWEHNGSGVAGSLFHSPDNITRGSTLRLQHISGAHGGNYSCVPARIHAQTVVLHVPDAAEKRLPYNGGPAVVAASPVLAAVCLLGAIWPNWRPAAVAQWTNFFCLTLLHTCSSAGNNWQEEKK
jgi:hypothetical protein